MKIVHLTTDNREPLRQYDNPKAHFGPAPEALLQGFALLPEVEVHVISCAQRPMRSSPEKLAPNIWFHSLHVPKWGWIRTGYGGCIRAVRRQLHEIAPDIVHGQGTERECAMSAAYSGFPNVLTLHGCMAALARCDQPLLGKLYTRGAAFFERVAVTRTDGVCCISRYTQRLVASRARKTWLVPNGIRSAFFETPLRRRGHGRPVLLNVGSIVPWKGQLEVLDLARELHAQGGDFLLRFVGGLDKRTAYGSAFAAKLEAAQRAGYAEYVAIQGIEGLLEMLDSASALVHAPKEEAFGLVVAEALSRNLKFFGFDVGGVSDIANGVEGAELFAPGASAEMVAAIRRWLEAGAPTPARAAETIRDRFHPSLVAIRHVEIYQEVLRAHPPSSPP